MQNQELRPYMVETPGSGGNGPDSQIDPTGLRNGGDTLTTLIEKLFGMRSVIGTSGMMSFLSFGA